MTQTERLMKLCTASPKVLAQIDAVLLGTATAPKFEERDVRTCTFTEGAKRLGISRPTLYRLTQMGKIRTVRLCGVNRVVLASLLDFADGKEAK